MQEQVLWAIDYVLEGRQFEQLCVDLLYRNGYRTSFRLSLRMEAGTRRSCRAKGGTGTGALPTSSSVRKQGGRRRFGRMRLSSIVEALHLLISSSRRVVRFAALISTKSAPSFAQSMDGRWLSIPESGFGCSWKKPTPI